MEHYLIAPIILAVASLLWPVVAITGLVLFKKEIVSVLHRLTKAEILGQKIELREELAELEDAVKATVVETKALPKEQKRLQDPKEEETVDSTVKSILEKAASDPKLALVALSAELERQARQNLATRGLLGGRRAVSLSQALNELNKYGFPPNLAGSFRLFLDVRNKIVHGVGGATNDDAISALDSGLTILRALNALPNEINVVYHPGVDLFSDAQATNPISDAKGLILETTSPGGAVKTFRIFPTTHTGYEKGKRVAWEWNLGKTWPATWYRDLETGEIKKAWDASAEFVGRHLDDI
jgi:hypothetical protein